MARHREAPTCAFCGKAIATAVHNEPPSILGFYGDTFSHWRYDKHSCKEEKQFFDNMRKELEG